MRLERESTSFQRPRAIIKMDKRYMYAVTKRCMDFLGALIGLILLSPIFVVVGIAIKLDGSNGPVFYRQVRVGKNGSQFHMYKFRSMINNADQMLDELKALNEVSGAMFKIKNDPRVTRIGRFIRKTSIDELPQFINVLLGEMSLVGPRPPLPNEVDEYRPYDRQRLLVTPGCTGIWQVSGRNEVGFEEMVELDLKYIRERSIAMDLKLIVKTVDVMVNSKGAY
ncbi:multidrug MFS transporter [Paenibacillus selenitireducens]|uniref:Multidrug MFS transporter n=2 Tax=Paenibacillus selenitireducens TaxID=1324314 RepID=A0A1T2XLF3_9BACL|nr:multidrug MFS transporter [Paenibacillus selenitireducens]